MVTVITSHFVSALLNFKVTYKVLLAVVTTGKTGPPVPSLYIPSQDKFLGVASDFILIVNSWALAGVPEGAAIAALVALKLSK